MAAAPARPQSPLWPREHGAWGLLLQPFLAGAILGGDWNFYLIPALGVVLLGFALREPLVVLARQAFVWRERNPQFGQAARWVLLELAGLLSLAYWLSFGLPWPILLSFLAVGALLTPPAVWVTLRNRQRSRLFQAASAVALGSTSLLAASVSAGAIPAWAWTLWCLLSLHGVAAILVVHVRLKMKIAARSVAPPGLGRHYALQALQIPAAGLLALTHPPLLLPPLFTVILHWFELRRIASPCGLNEPLTRVGLRTLAVAILHSILTIVTLWPVSQLQALGGG